LGAACVWKSGLTTKGCFAALAIHSRHTSSHLINTLPNRLRSNSNDIVSTASHAIKSARFKCHNSLYFNYHHTLNSAIHPFAKGETSDSRYVRRWVMCTCSNQVTGWYIRYNITKRAKAAITNIHIIYNIIQVCIRTYIIRKPIQTLSTCVYDLHYSVYISLLLLYLLTMISDTDIFHTIYRQGTHSIARSRKVQRSDHNRANKVMQFKQAYLTSSRPRICDLYKVCHYCTV
jgi:hypothetical protein